MYFYFTGEYKAAIKINGMFYGILSEAIKTLRVDNGSPFIEICPLERCGQTVNLILDAEFLCAPPEGVSVTDLKGGYLLKFYKNTFERDFKIISQQKYNDCVATLFNENGLKLSIETKDDFYAETFAFDFVTANFTRFELNGINFLALHFEDNNNLYIYYLSKNITKVFARQVNEFSFDGIFKTVELYKDIAKHKVISEWVFEQNQFVSKNIDASYRDGFSPNNLHQKLIPYAFLEAFLLNAEWKDYLCQNILENADKLKGFFGDFIGVIPSPTFRDINQVGLLYKTKENLYSVDYFTFEMCDNKIFNINKIET